MPEDKRMLFVRNIEALRESSRARTTEYLVIVDAHIVGELSYGPYYFTIWEFTKKEPGEERWLCLRVREKEQDPEEWQRASESGFYHGGGVASEIIALSSLLLRRRLRLQAVVRMDDLPRTFTLTRAWADPHLVNGHSNLSDLEPRLRLVETLNPDYHQSFILATRLYHHALGLVEENSEMAYLALVSAVEVLAERYEIDKPPLQELDPQLAGLISQVDSADLRHRLQNRILARERLIARKFKRFILDHVQDSFWQYEGRPEHGKIEPTELPDLLARIYNQRSRTLHTGEPFPPNAVGPPVIWEEIDRSLGMSAGERSWTPEEYIPHVHFFERLVNHVLISFLDKNQGRK